MIHEFLKKPIIISLIASIILYFILVKVVNPKIDPSKENVNWYDQNTIMYSVITGIVVFFGIRSFKKGNDTIVDSSANEISNKKIVNGENILVSPY